MSTLDKRIEQMLYEFRRLCAHDSYEGGLPDYDKAFKTIISQYHQDLHTENIKSKEYELDIKKFLTQANWGHEDFGVVAHFFSKGTWKVTSDMLMSKEETPTYACQSIVEGGELKNCTCGKCF